RCLASVSHPSLPRIPSSSACARISSSSMPPRSASSSGPTPAGRPWTKYWRSPPAAGTPKLWRRGGPPPASPLRPTGGRMRFSEPLLLLLLPLAVLPLLRPAAAGARYPWLELVPADSLSNTLDWLLRAAAAVAIAATAIGLAGPYLPGTTVERVGRGAEIVVLLDRSLSMDEPLGSASQARFYAFAQMAPESKQSVARRFLSRFVARRAHDLMGLIIFSTFPIPVLPFTARQPLIQAAIHAGATYHGLADTDIGAALLAAARMFENQPYTGSRVVLLVSDGGAVLDTPTRVKIRTAF